jgi:hypothetical protein
MNEILWFPAGKQLISYTTTGHFLRMYIPIVFLLLMELNECYRIPVCQMISILLLILPEGAIYVDERRGTQWLIPL